MYKLTSTATEQKREEGEQFPMLMTGDKSGDTYLVTSGSNADYTGALERVCSMADARWQRWV